MTAPSPVPAESTGGLSAEHEGRVLDVAVALAEASDDGCFDPHREAHSDAEDRAYWMRLARAAVATDAAALDRVRAETWPCANYAAPVTCLTAPSTEAGRCGWCATQANSVSAEVAEEIALAIEAGRERMRNNGDWEITRYTERVRDAFSRHDAFIAREVARLAREADGEVGRMDWCTCGAKARPGEPLPHRPRCYFNTQGDGSHSCPQTLMLLYGSAACDYRSGHDGLHHQAASGRTWTTEKAQESREADR